MGQYYKAVCLDTKQCYTPDGVKLMEHSYLNTGVTLSVANLLYGDNEWAGKRLVWAGDYGKGTFEQEFPNRIRFRKEDPEDEYEYSLYTIASNWFEELGVRYSSEMDWEEYNKATENAFWDAIGNGAKDIQYFVNEDLKEYINLAQVDKKESIHPLPILCSYGCGEGGGDYFQEETHPSYQYIGSWAGHRIRAYKTGEELNLAGYTYINPGFTQEWETE